MRQGYHGSLVMAVGSLCGLGILVTGCRHDVSAPGSRDVGPVMSTAPTRVHARTLDELFLDLAARIPGGFGGLFLRDGEYVLWLKDLDESGAAVQALARLTSGSRREIRPDRVRMLEADFDWIELYGWYSGMRDVVWRHDGVVTTDIDEGRNRIVIGLEDPSARAGVERLLRDHGAPLRAVVFEQRDPPVLFSDLQDHHRPAIGGYQIQIGSRPECTLGLNVEYELASGGTDYGFVTTAHCTNNPGVVNQDFAYQETLLDTEKVVGREERDPPLFQGGACPSGWSCRYTDAALVRYDSASLMTRGVIERTLWNSIVVDADTTKRWKIIDDDNGCGVIGCAIIQGDPVEKVGRTTGWTSGEIVRTCEDVVNPDRWPQDTILLCQDWVGEGSATPIAEPGDSGAAVFRKSGCCNAYLYGLLVGGNQTQNATEYFLSRIHLIKDELGWFDATAEPEIE